MRLAAAACLVLAGCSVQQQDQLTRDAARSAITPVLAARVPGVPIEPALTCVMNAASAVQIRALALDSVAGPTESTMQIVTDIVSKPETSTCLAAKGLPVLLR